MIKILKKDEKYFAEKMSHTKLSAYFKTKDNSLRIAIFENGEFLAIENQKAYGIFQETVLNKDNSYKLKNKQQELNVDGTLKCIIYFGIKTNNEDQNSVEE